MDPINHPQSYGGFSELISWYEKSRPYSHNEVDYLRALLASRSSIKLLESCDKFDVYEFSLEGQP